MRDIWFDDDEMCLGCGEVLEQASGVPGLCRGCAIEDTLDDSSLFEDWDDTLDDE